MGTANAAPAPVTIQSQYTGYGSNLNDGTNTTIKISATVDNGPIASGDGVQFSYQQATATLGSTTPLPGSNPVIIGTDFTFPYSIEWAPPAIGDFIETATVVKSDGTTADANYSTATKPVRVGGYSAVHITSPAEGGQIGVSGANTLGTGTYNQGQIVVSGTRSADLPDVWVYAVTRNNTDGSINGTPPAGGPSTAPTVPGKGATGASQNWTATVPVPQCTNTIGSAGCDVIIYATAQSNNGTPSTTGTDNVGPNGMSDEVTEATLYQQNLTQGSLTVAPATATVPASTPQKYTVTAKDQSGQPIAGLMLQVCADNSNAQVAPDNAGAPGAWQFTSIGSSCLNPLHITTGSAGTAIFWARDNNAPETTTLTVTSEFGGATPNFNNGINSDVNATAKLITYTAQATTGAFSAVPQKTIYASNSATYPNAGATEYSAYTNGAENIGNTPQTLLCFVDQNGNAFPTSSNSSNPLVTITRQYTPVGGGTTTTEIYTNDASKIGTANYTGPVTLTPDGSKANCYDVSHPATPADKQGSDTYTATLSGTSTPAMTLKWAPLTLAGNGNTLAQKGGNVSGSFKVVGTDGTPFTGRVIALSVPGGAAQTTNGYYFPNTQPSGTTVPNGSNNNSLTATCTVDANGNCNFTITEPANGGNPDNTVTVTATDSITTAAPGPYTQIATGLTASETVTFTNTSVAVTTATVASEYALFPASTNGSNWYNNNPGAPGAPDVVTLTLKNQSGQLLTNAPVHLTTSHGWFTNPPTAAHDYTKLTFAHGPSEGEDVGSPNNDLVNNGTAVDLTTNGAGQVTFALAIGRDSAFDNTGDITDVVGVTSNGGSVLVTDPTNGGGPTWSTNSNNTNESPVNPGGVSLLPTATGGPLSGNVQSNLPNGQRNGKNFLVHTTDAWGNLVQDWNREVTVAANGTATDIDSQGNTINTPGSYLGEDNNPNWQHNVTDFAQNTSGQDVTVTGTWNARTTSYTQHFVTGSPTVPPSWDMVQGTKQLTDSFTIHLYEIDLSNLHITHSLIPGNNVPVGTTVSDKNTVTDQNNNPVKGIEVDFFQSGPGSNVDNQTCRFTDPTDGSATYSFSSSNPGTATVTTIVTKNFGNVCAFGGGSGNEAFRSVDNITFGNGGGGNNTPGSLPAYRYGNANNLRNSLTTGAASSSFGFGNSGDVPLWGDWNGDGTPSIGVYRPSNGTFYLGNNAGTAAQFTFAFGNHNWMPLVGDWNGDGTTTVGVYDPSTATFYLNNVNASGKVAGIRYGDPGDHPIAGDWTAAGRTTIGVYRPSNGTFYLKGLRSTGYKFGNKGDTPIVGDWDGNGTTTIGVVRGTTWYVANDNATAPNPFTFGRTGAKYFTWTNVATPAAPTSS